MTTPTVIEQSPTMSPVIFDDFADTGYNAELDNAEHEIYGDTGIDESGVLGAY